MRFILDIITWRWGGSRPVHPPPRGAPGILPGCRIVKPVGGVEERESPETKTEERREGKRERERERERERDQRDDRIRAAP